MWSRRSGRKDNCLQNFKPDAHACTFGPDDAHRRAIVLGDSVAISWVPAIRAALGDGWRIDVWTMTQCPAALVSVKATDGTPYAKCDDFHTKTTVDLAAATADLVFLGQASNTSDRIVPSDGVSGKEALTEGLAQRVRDIAAHVGHVVVLGSNVEMSKALAECYTRVSKPNDCAMAVPGTHAAIAAAEEASIEGVVNAQFVSPDPWMCHQNKCPVFVGSNVVLADKLHFTDAFSRAIGPALGEVLRAGGSLE